MARKKTGLSVSQARTAKRPQPAGLAAAARAGRPPVAGRSLGKTLLSRIQEIMQERSLKPDGRYNTRFDDVADAYVGMMEKGSFIHAKEVIDRQDGKVPTRLADADGNNLKLYMNMPTDEEQAP